MLSRSLSLVSAGLLASASFAQLDLGTSNRIDGVFSAWNRSDAPGGVVGVVKDGKLVYAKGFGMANLDYRIPLTSKSVTDIGSVTKHFVSTALLMLEDEGKLSLDDPASKYLPELPANSLALTLRQFLTHTSGIRDYLTCMALSGWQMGDPLREEAALEMISRQQALNFPPGTSFNYSNTGYFLAGLVVGRVSGMPLASFLKKRIFEPLGMENSLIYDDTSKIIPGRADSFTGSGAAWRRLVSGPAVVGDGGLMTTVEDFAKWDLALKNNTLGIKGGHLQRLSEPAKLANGAALPYGLGMMLGKVGEVPRTGHGGAWLGYFSDYQIFPSKGLSVFAFGNNGTNNTAQLVEDAAKILLGQDKEGAPRKTIAWTDKLYDQIEGKWALPGGAEMRIFRLGEDKKLQVTGQPAFNLYLESEDKAFIKEAPLTLTRLKADGAGKWEEMELRQQTPGGEVKLNLKRLAPFKITPEAAALWHGRWFNPDLRLIYRFEPGTGASTVLVMPSQGKEEKIPINFSSADQVRVGILTFKLVAGAEPKILMDAGRANGFVFTRLR